VSSTLSGRGSRSRSRCGATESAGTAHPAKALAVLDVRESPARRPTSWWTTYSRERCWLRNRWTPKARPIERVRSAFPMMVVHPFTLHDFDVEAHHFDVLPNSNQSLTPQTSTLTMKTPSGGSLSIGTRSHEYGGAGVKVQRLSYRRTPHRNDFGRPAPALSRAAKRHGLKIEQSILGASPLRATTQSARARPFSAPC